MNAKTVRQLREETGAGVMECKKALDDARGNVERAKALIRERGIAKVEKRSGRETGSGLVKSYVHNGRIGVLLDLRAETDFVVRSAPFQTLAQELVMQIAAADPETNEELLAQPYIRDESQSVSDVVNATIAKVGENIRVGKFFRLEI